MSWPLLIFNVNINNEILVPVFINGNVANSKFEPDSQIESQLGDNIDLYLTLSTDWLLCQDQII